MREGVMKIKGDKVLVKSSGSVQMESISLMLGAALPIIISPQNSLKGASLRNDSTKVSSLKL